MRTSPTVPDRRLSWLVLGPLLGALLTGAARPQDPAAVPGEDLARPAEPRRDAARLLVLVAVDQLIPEQLERLRPWLGGGFGRFLREGQLWRNAEHQHANTETGPGHATLGTGVHPSRSGIVANAWLSREGSVYCCADELARDVSSDGLAADAGSVSGRQLLVPGLAEHLRARHPGSRSVGISVKDRSAILSAGQRATWAFWWDRGGRGFVTSDAYGVELPEWVRAWNQGWPEQLLVEGGYVWEPGFPTDFEGSGTAPDERPGEMRQGGSSSFPHRAPAVAGGNAGPADLQRLARWATASPLGDRFVAELATRAVESLELGADAEPDLLAVSFSACDIVGHLYGPYSQEVTSVLLAADATLAELFAALDERVGPGRWVAALSADHGVLELPESLAERGVDAHRVSSTDLGGALEELRPGIAERFGADFHLRFSGEGVLLDREAMATAGVDAKAVRRAYADALLERVPWLARAYTADELSTPVADVRSDPLRAVVARSFHPERSPDVLLVTRPWTLLDAGVGTSHGSPYPYDRGVPLAFYGPGTPAETRFDPCATVDLLPTLMHRAGLPVPEGLDGRVLDGEGSD